MRQIWTNVQHDGPDDLGLCLSSRWQENHETLVPDVVPCRENLSTPCGLLVNELVNSPTTLFRCVRSMIDTSLELDPGKHTASAGSVILYVMRLAVRIESYALMLMRESVQAADSVRGMVCR